MNILFLNVAAKCRGETLALRLLVAWLLCLSPLLSANAAQNQADLEVQAQQLLSSARDSLYNDEIEQALVSLNHAYQITTPLTQSAISREVLTELATIYYNSNQLVQAERYYKELVTLNENHGSQLSLATALYNLGHVYAKKQQFIKSAEVFNRSLVISDADGDQVGMAYTLKALGANALGQEDLPLARQFMISALSAFQYLNDDRQVAFVYKSLGDLEVAIGNQDIAVAYYQEALPMMVMLDMDEPLVRLHLSLSNSYAELFEFQSAYIMQNTYLQLLQQQWQQQNSEAIQRLLVEFETERFADENKILEIETQNQRTTLIFSFCFIGLVLAVLLKMRLYSQRMRFLATTDELTGLLNRRAIMDYGMKEWQRSERFNRPLTCLMLDIDHFKSINDNYGHGVGDKVLIAVSDVLQSTLRNTDELGRFGGEEFLLLAPETDLQQAGVLAERIREKVEAIEHESLGERKVTVSTGMAQISDESDLEDLIKHADSALYQAKDEGRNRVSVFMPELEGFLAPAL